MKKLIPIMIIMTLLITLTSPVLAVTNPIRVFVDGTEVQFPDQKPIINSDNRTLVPVRFISEDLGAEVQWIALTRTVKINYQGKTILLEIGLKQALVGTSVVTLDTKAEIINSRTMVPLRFVSECLNAVVAYEPVGTVSMINIFTKGQTPEEQQKVITTSKNVIEAGYMGEYWGEIDEYSRTKPSPEVHDAQVAKDKASVTSELVVGSEKGDDNPHGLDIAMQIRMWNPLEPQYADAERILTSRLGTANAKIVMDYAKTKTDEDYWLVNKTWNMDGRTVMVIQGPGPGGIELRVYYAK